MNELLDSDILDMVQKDQYNSYDNSDFDVNVFDDDPFCSSIDDQSFMFDNELSKSVKLDDNRYHTLRSKCDSESSHYKPRF